MSIKQDVLNSLQQAEEIGGVKDTAEYCLLISELIVELSTRLQVALKNK